RQALAEIHVILPIDCHRRLLLFRGLGPRPGAGRGPALPGWLGLRAPGPAPGPWWWSGHAGVQVERRVLGGAGRVRVVAVDGEPACGLLRVDLLPAVGNPLVLGPVVQ